MKITEIPGAIAELNRLTEALAVGEELALDNPALMASNFYQVMQTLRTLDASNAIGLTVAGMNLLAQIAGTSPALFYVDISYNGLGEHGIAAAAHLAGSETINIVNISNNNLGEHGAAVAALLAESETITNVYIDANALGEHGVTVAFLLAESETISVVNLSDNNLGEHGVAVAAHLAESETISVVNLSDNALEEHSVAIATHLAESHSLLTVRLGFQGMMPEIIRATRDIIDSHNRLIEERSALEDAIGDIYSGAGKEYGFMGDLIGLVALGTHDDFDNVIVMT